VAQNILDFDKQFPGARTIKLEQNYRSSTTILNAANAVIANNKKRRAKTLWSELGQGQKVSWFELSDETEEAQFVASDIHQQRDGGRRPWSDFAILMRVAGLSRPFEEALRTMEIPYKLVGGKAFFDRREIKDLAAYMQAILNPSNEVGIRRAINTPRRGVGSTAIIKISDHARLKRVPLHAALRQYENIEGLTPANKRGVKEYLDVVDEFKLRFEREPLDTALKALVEKLQYEDWILRTEKSEKVARIRLKNVEELVLSAGSYYENNGIKGLNGYLSRLTLDGSQKSEEGPKDQVTLMTLHASKGLEFPQVFLVGFEEELLPHARSLEVGGDGDLEEERRLAYVGITRAKARLVLTSAKGRGRGQMARKKKPSRFLTEIPEELISKNGYDPYVNRTAEVTKAARRQHLAAMRDILFND